VIPISTEEDQRGMKNVICTLMAIISPSISSHVALPQHLLSFLLKVSCRAASSSSRMMRTGDELRQKIGTEKREIERLKQDFADLQMIREDMYDSDDSSSTSSEDSDDGDDDLRDILQQLLRENADLEVCCS